MKQISVSEWLEGSKYFDVLDDSDKDFIINFNRVAIAVYENSVVKGFWDESNPLRDGELIALIHSELSEALEALRNGNPADDKLSEFSGLEAELADCVIRIMQMGIAKKLRLPEAILAKVAYNHCRPYKHGKEF